MEEGEATLTPLAGGHGGETFLAVVGGERTVVRIYGRSWERRGDAAAEIDAAVLRLVRGLLPVPDVIEVRRGNADNGLPPLLVSSFVEGARLDELFPKLSEKKLRTVARNVGVIASRLAQMPMLSTGAFVDGSLRIGSLGPNTQTLSEFVDAKIERAPALRAWAAEDIEALRGYALYSQGLLSDVTRRTLVHGDFQPKNLLVDPRSLDIVAVVDWEMAHAGLPLSDLGSVLRYSESNLGKIGRAFDDAVLRTFAELVADANVDKANVDRLHERARAADLFALVELAARREMNPTANAAHDLLLGTVRAFRSRN
jgi:aminoglycoside phosphotransferase (APT) family kinase protein